jgi:glycosyltransferase involved in cell wall biosynthesis
VKARKASYDRDYDCIPIDSPFLVHLNRVLKSTRPDVVYWRYDKHHLLPAVLLVHHYHAAFVFAISHLSNTKRWIASGTKVFKFNFNRKQNIIKTSLRAIRRPLISALNYNGFYFIDVVVCLNDDLVNKLPVKRQVKIYNSMFSKYIPFEWSKPYIVWVASIKTSKNPEKFIELAARFQEKNMDFLMVGRIANPKYNYILNDSTGPSNFHYLGEKKPGEVNGILKSSLFLVHTCNPEGFPNNFVQAWLQGKPTISLYYDPEGVITNNQIGFLSGRMEKMVEDVDRLITDETLRNAMGKRAQEFAAKRFSPETNARKLESLLLSVANQHHPT